jgi:hypothetical protein
MQCIILTGKNVEDGEEEVCKRANGAASRKPQTQTPANTRRTLNLRLATHISSTRSTWILLEACQVSMAHVHLGGARDKAQTWILCEKA